MGAQMDNPFDGRRAQDAAPADEYDGGIYAEGCQVLVRSKRTGRGITLGGPIAEAQNAATAVEIARRCAAFEPMLAALKGALPFMEGAEAASLVGDEGCQWPVEVVRAAIAQAEGR